MSNRVQTLMKQLEFRVSDHPIQPQTAGLQHQGKMQKIARRSKKDIDIITQLRQPRFLSRKTKVCHA